MFETMIIRVITFFSDIGVWFTRNFLPHNPHTAKEPQFVDEFMVKPPEPVVKIEEATPQVQTAKEFMQQSIEIVSKAEEELKVNIDAKTEEIFSKVIEEAAKVEKPVEEVLKEVTATVENVSKVKLEQFEFVKTETKVAEKLIEEVDEVVAEVVEETAKKVKRATRKKAKKEQED